MSPLGRFCCKSLFALVTKNSPGCRGDFRVKMWGTSSCDDKLTGDLGKVIEATRIGGHGSDRVLAGKFSPGNFGLLQQYLPGGDSCTVAKRHPYSITDGSFDTRVLKIRRGPALNAATGSTKRTRANRERSLPHRERSVSDGGTPRH